MNTATLPLLQHPRTISATWLGRAGAAVWRALEASGQARARRHLLDFADHCETLQPELAKELRAACRHDAIA